MAPYRDLNFVLPKSRAIADYGVLDPENAWPGAQSKVRLRVFWLENGLLAQEGWNAGEPTSIWARYRNPGGGWTDWQMIFLGDPGGGTIGADAFFADGAQAIALPDYAKLAFISATGMAATLEGDDLRIAASGMGAVEFRVTVFHNWGSSVIFGYAWDGGEPQELGRILIESSEPVFAIARHSIELVDGALLSLFISSDFEWQAFSWASGEVIFVVPESAMTRAQ